jgi:hypothetical protein
MFHQHFNTGTTPSRYLAVQFGTVRYPMISAKMKKWTSGNDTSVKDGGNQIEYEDQPTDNHAIWLEEMDKKGHPSEMSEIFEEDDIRASNYGKSAHK